MRRRLFTTASLLSILLLVAIMVLWVRSYWVFDTVSVPRHHRQWMQFVQVRGRIQLIFNTASSEPAEFGFESVRLDKLEAMLPPSESTDMTLHPRYFEWAYTDASHRGKIIRFYTIGLPHWLLFSLLSAPLVTMIYWRWRYRQFTNLNRCSSCGYDLTSNSSGMCPECGNPIYMASSRR